MTVGKEIVKQIDGRVAATENRERGRRHLGASSIGSPCPRAVYYSWRWFYQVHHGGRLLRLWARGHREEDNLIGLLGRVGIKVLDRNPDTGEQFKFSAHMGHFGGSCDGWIVPFTPFEYEPGHYLEFDLPAGIGLFEAKTYNDKRFKTLSTGGVLSTAPEYYNQMQIYMKAFGLAWALFLAVNKNDDTLYAEVIHYREEIAEAYFDRAAKIIEAKAPPKRITEDPSWFKCKMCDFREVCHKGATPQKNCRTCVFSRATEGATFTCDRFCQVIPFEFEPQGCSEWVPIA